MKHGWLAVVFGVNIIKLLSVHSASVDFPNFPTKDDYGIVIGTNSNPVDDDITDNGPAAPLKMTHLRVRSEIALRYARTAVVSNVYNPSKRPQEATFQVLLPETAFISGFTMTLGKETYEAYVKEKEVAKQIYNDAVAQGVSAAHVATKARDSNHFTIKFNLEGRSNATYRLTYEELLVRRNGVYNHAINLLPGALVPTMDVVVHIKESQKISVLRVPELRTGNEIDATENDAQNANAVIKKSKNEREATITFTPNLAEQKRLAEIYAEKSKKSSDPDSYNIGYDSSEEENENVGLLGQFVVQYDVVQPKNGEILVNDGYFVHFFAPTSLPPLSKHAVFVLDTSGSMAGNKISQLITAMNAILSDLNPRDHFSIIEFNTHVTVHRLNEADNVDNINSLVPPAIASPENIVAAKIIISKFRASGGTNINSALDMAINLIQNVVSQTNLANGTNSDTDNLEPIIIFLTDGEPTVGETDRDRIIRYLSVKNDGERRAPLYSLAFGDDADRVFLRKLSLRNEGFMRHIYEAADAALQLHHFYRQVSSPLLADVKFLYPHRQIKEGSVSRSEFRTINDGSEVAVVGRIAEDVNEITPQVRGLRGDGHGRRESYEINHKVPVKPEKDDHLPLELLWAYLTIKQLLDKRDAGDDSHGDSTSSKDSPEQKALAIALKYSFVTPLTSLVVVRLNKTDVVDPVDVERVDVPNVRRFRSVPVAPSSLMKQIYTGFASGDSLSVASSDGPVLYAQSTRLITDSGYGLSKSDQNGRNTATNGNLHRRDFDHGDPDLHQNYNRGEPFEEKYHLKGFNWTPYVYRQYTDTLAFKVNGTEVVLYLTENIDPPKMEGGDVECVNSTPLTAEAVAGVAESAGSVCVYISRCSAARDITVDDYRNSYCIVNNMYAGICCPRSEVDK
ncbi:inter-alpha-trypsin inhibitor heavy chain H6-like isoform X2 [Maniola jurtina]|uniref:inter-alpha-trypsin inhibitor heavy chain H6-like isoform X2 n=1 Tax=Maniola jurtina TaxID=191418 RepID=UPI001E688CEC|nr:inter-alpha-trypsin inhibitor heavy chain H6-like isoform X2 [Maniola jurtina]